ncbi:MAG: RNA polymerase sigma factor [Acidimicrobiia bacterium]
MSRADRHASDLELTRAAASGDRDALETLLDRHLDRIHAVCRRVCGPNDAMDATQNTLIAITRAIHRFDGRAAFTTWAHRIAVNAALDELRRAKRRGIPSSDRPELTAAVAAADRRGPDQVADRLDLDAALATLPEDFRTAVVLRDVADLDYAEIAATLGIPIGTVRSRIARGRAALAAALGNSTPAADVQGSDHG